MNQPKCLSKILERLPMEQISNLQKQMRLTMDGLIKVSEAVETIKLDVKMGKCPFKDLDSEIFKIEKEFVSYATPYYKNLYQLSCPIQGIEKSREFIADLIEVISYSLKKEILKNLNL